jgi:hypothetical protein
VRGLFELALNADLTVLCGLLRIGMFDVIYYNKFFQVFVQWMA